jgi:hypothetical protein
VRCDIAVIKTSHNFYMNDSHWQVCHFHAAWAGIVPCSLYQHAGIVTESGPWTVLLASFPIHCSLIMWYEHRNALKLLQAKGSKCQLIA